MKQLNNMKKNLIIFSIIAILLCWNFVINAAINYSVRDTLSLATGSKDGVYYALAQGIEKAIENKNPSIEIIVQATEGSVENAMLLQAKSVQLAMIQNDIAYYFFNGQRMFNFPSKKMVGIASLYTEAIQIIARKELNINNVSDLKGRVVAVGSENSGTRFNAAVILSAMDFEYEDIKEICLSFNEAKDSLIYGSIDAAFITAGFPTPSISELGNKINLLSIDLETITKLRKNYPFFVYTRIPPNTYQGQLQEVFVLGVRALLVARKDLGENVIKQISQAIFTDDSKYIEKAHSVGSDISLKNVMNGLTIPLHSGAEQFYRDSDLIKQKSPRYFINIIFQYLVILFLAIIFLKNWNYIKKIVRRNIYVKLALVLLLFFLIGSFGAYFFEKNVNENFSSIYKTLWTSIVYIVSGFEDFTPITTGGKIFSLFIFIGSIGILGSVAGNFASIFLKGGEEKMPKNLNKHIAICNWNKRGDTVIRELHHPSAEPDKELIVLTDMDVNEKELRERSRKRYGNVYFIKGDPTSYETLESARVHLAKSVIILSREESDDPDPKAVLSCLAISKLANAENKPKPHIIVELMDRNNRQITLDAGADEIVSAGFYRTGIMLQSALYHKLSDIFHELLIYQENTNSFFIISKEKFPSILLGKTFQEASEIINKNRDIKNPTILIGVKRNNEVILNPPADSRYFEEKNFNTFKEGDALVVMSYKLPDLSNLKI